ncbi:MAG: methionine--tRNA ligase subunit beta, partial [Allobaculum sp.]|nr:methionine--tRNA ligase subunit beta [Allobaculum sp.]
LVSRTIAMENKYFQGKIENPGITEPVDEDLKAVAMNAIAKTEEKMEEFQVSAALDEIFTLLRRSNKYIDETEPWKLAKEPEKAARLQTVLYNLLESIRIAGVLLESFMPETSQKILDALQTNQRTMESIREFGQLETGISCVESIAPLFQRIDMKEFETPNEPVEKPKKKAKKEKKKKVIEPIQVDDFGKVSLKAGKILEAKVHPDADKLLIETIDVGEENPRQIVSGIAQNYTPEDLIGRTVIVVANLEPATLRGVESQGMLLCSVGKGGPKVVFLDDSVSPGSVIR